MLPFDTTGSSFKRPLERVLLAEEGCNILQRQRLLIELVVNEEVTSSWLALNEVNIHRGASGQMTWLECYLDQTRLTSSFTDGYSIII